MEDNLNGRADGVGNVIFEMRGIDKSFGATHALRKVRLTVRSHEVHAIMGENGAGKSTLMKVLGGAHVHARCRRDSSRRKSRQDR